MKTWLLQSIIQGLERELYQDFILWMFSIVVICDEKVLKWFQQADAAPITKGVCLTRTAACIREPLFGHRNLASVSCGTEEEASHPQLVSELVCGPPAVALDTNGVFHVWLWLVYWLLPGTGPQSLWNGGDPGRQKHDWSFLGSSFMTEFLYGKD